MSDTAPDTEPITAQQPRKPRRWPWITALPIALVAGVVLGFAAHQPETVKVPTQATVQQVEAMDRRSANLDKQDEDARAFAQELSEWEANLDQREQELDERAKALDEREADISQQEEVVAQNTITDGVWTVGLDVSPGTYRASDVPSLCYWEITTSGSNGYDIVSNGIPGGGNPTVTLSEGQDFTTQDCGEWHLQQQ